MNEERDKRSGVDKLFWVVTGVLTLLLIGALIWRGVSIHRAEDRAQTALEVRTQEMLRLAAIPLAWAVREQALDRNYGRVTEYFDELVREPKVAGILLAAANDSILVATDRALLGQRLGTALTGVRADASAIHVERAENGYHVVVPISGFATREATVVLTYEAEEGRR